MYESFRTVFLDKLRLKLLSTAILHRRLEYKYKALLKEAELDNTAFNKNIFIPNFGFDYSKYQPLKSLREVSNKIIHADGAWLYGEQSSIDQNLKSSGYFDDVQLGSAMYLSGQKYKDTWLVAIDFFAYGESLSSVSDVLSENYGI